MIVGPSREGRREGGREGTVGMPKHEGRRRGTELEEGEGAKEGGDGSSFSE